MAKQAKHKIIIGVALFLVALILVALLFLYLSFKSYQNKIYPNVYLGSHSLGGLTKTEALNLIKVEAKKIEDQGLKFDYNNKKVEVDPVFAASQDVFAYDIFSLNPEISLQNIYDSQGTSFLSYLSFRTQTLFKDKLFTFVYQLNPDNLTKTLQDAYQEQETPATNASFKIASVKDSSFQVEAEKNGQKINYTLAISEIQENLKQLRNPLVYLKSEIEYPSVYQKDLPNLEPEARAILARGDLVLSYNDKTWKIKPEILATWLKSATNNGKFYLTLDIDKVKEYLQSKIAPDLDKEIMLPRFSMVNSNLASWQTGKDGQKLNLEASANKIEENYIANRQNTSNLIVDVIKTDNLNPDNNFNIQEIIGTGHSTFTGSPTNRRFNIKVGAAALNGLLIKPGEEFSLVKVLGNVDASSGYLPELVIKGSKTVPEYGGGLCQIATTVFRTALQSGLPITERRNHSYRVVYYEPAGTDAAVYIPHPDMRFINDTGNYILIQARIEKNELYFDFWGVKDGRQVTLTTPVVYNIVRPAPKRIVETTDLKPGVTKCTEKAHNGADAYFDYKIVYPVGSTVNTSTEKIVRFSSHYIPWQEVCLVGVKASSTAPLATSTAPLATSTPVINTNASSTTNTGTSTNP